MEIIRRFITRRKGNLIENIIYLIIIGSLSYVFYTEKFETPMSQNMDNLNTKISEWTQIN